MKRLSIEFHVTFGEVEPEERSEEAGALVERSQHQTEQPQIGFTRPAEEDSWRG